jgi:hypothetical protein
MPERGGTGGATILHDHRLAGRFLGAWKQLEVALDDRWAETQVKPSASRLDSASLLLWARQAGVVSSETERFLNTCRRARNAYVHVTFEGYAGPVALPPTEVVHRLERLAQAIRQPPSSKSVAVRAITCEPTTPLRTALQAMREGDFSQVPYLHGGEWLLVTREQIARHVEAQADVSGHALVDLNDTVASLASDPAVGPIRPRTIEVGRPLFEAVTELEDALRTPDHQDFGYPVVLLTSERDPSTVHLLAADDLPVAYRALGRT